MPFLFYSKEQAALIRTLVKWVILGCWAGVVSGAASAVFLLALDAATRYREANPWLLCLLPVCGILIYFAYSRYGKDVEAGNNLLLETVHNPEATIPFRMAPMVLISTVATHLFGGSAGREGTAVQMGASLANLARGPLKLSAADHRILVMSGISGGFGSVFGTPLAGTVFGLEVLTIGRMSYEAIIPCFVASVVGDIVCRSLGVVHHKYPTVLTAEPSLKTWVLIVISGALFAGAAALFGELTHQITQLTKKHLPRPWMRPVVGGLAVIGLAWALGTRAYLGLSLPLIAQSFTPQGVPTGAFLLKILFTAITLGTGFKGGEVTPLFCIGATLGAAFAHFTHQPIELFAALGFVAVFAGAANTPLACAVMGIELFGHHIASPLMAACIVSYILSGHRGIYLSQRIHTPKSQSIKVAQGVQLRETRIGIDTSILTRRGRKMWPQQVDKDQNQKDQQ